MPKFIEVDSSHVEAVAHSSNNDDMERNTMQVRFKGGKVFEYSPITEEGYRAMLDSESIGQYLHRNVKNNSNVDYREL